MLNMLLNLTNFLSVEGLLGFYAGIIPHLLGEVSGKAVEIIIQELIDKLEVLTTYT